MVRNLLAICATIPFLASAAAANPIGSLGEIQRHGRVAGAKGSPADCDAMRRSADLRARLRASERRALIEACERRNQTLEVAGRNPNATEQ